MRMILHLVKNCYKCLSACASLPFQASSNTELLLIKGGVHTHFIDALGMHVQCTCTCMNPALSRSLPIWHLTMVMNFCLRLPHVQVAYILVSEPDPRKIEKEGLVNWLGWKCTLRPVCRRTSDWLLISILMCVN